MTKLKNPYVFIQGVPRGDEIVRLLRNEHVKVGFISVTNDYGTKVSILLVEKRQVGKAAKALDDMGYADKKDLISAAKPLDVLKKYM
jgi:hypothetical protein